MPAEDQKIHPGDRAEGKIGRASISAACREARPVTIGTSFYKKLISGVLQDHVQNAPLAVQFREVHVVDPAAGHNFYAGSITINIQHLYASDALVARYVLSTSQPDAFPHGLNGIFGDLRLAVYCPQSALMKIWM